MMHDRRLFGDGDGNEYKVPPLISFDARPRDIEPLNGTSNVAVRDFFYWNIYYPV